MDWKHYPTKNNYRLVFSPISTAAIHKISIPIAAAYKRFLYLKNLAMAEKMKMMEIMIVLILFEKCCLYDNMLLFIAKILFWMNINEQQTSLVQPAQSSKRSLLQVIGVHWHSADLKSYSWKSIFCIKSYAKYQY